MDILDENGVGGPLTVENSLVNPENFIVKDSLEPMNSEENNDGSANSATESADMNGIGETIESESAHNGNELEARLVSSSLITDKASDDDDNSSEPAGQHDKTAYVSTDDHQNDAAEVSSLFINDNHASDGSPETDNAVTAETSEHSDSLQSSSVFVSSQITEEPNQETTNVNSKAEEPNKEAVDVIFEEASNCCNQELELSEMVGSTVGESNEKEPLSCVHITTVTASCDQEGADGVSSLAVKTQTTTTVHISSSEENGEITVEDEDGADNVILSEDEAKLLEKLKYQPFDVAQELESLTSQQREKINLYQRRESLARVNSLKRHSPSSSISIAKRPSASSQGQSDSTSPVAFEQDQETCSKSSALLYVQQKYQSVGPSGDRKNSEVEETRPEKVIDTSTDLYQCMRLLAPKPYPNDSSNPSSPTHQKYSPATPDLGSKMESRPKANKISSEGDILSGLKNASRVDRSQSFKTQADIDRNRQNVNAMRMKFLGLEVPPNIPNNNISKLDSPDGAEHNELNDEIEDFVVMSKKDVKLESSVKPPHTPKSKAGIESEPVAESTPISDQKSKENPLTRSFYKLLCGSGNSRE